MATTLLRFCLALMIIESVGAASRAFGQRAGSTNRASESATGSIEGRVVLPSGQPVPGRIRITLSTMNDPGLALYTDSNGGFIFSNLRAATYYIEAAGDPKAYEPVVEQVRLLRGTRHSGLIIHLRERTPESNMNATGGTVSIGEADSQVPAAARKEFDKATRLVRENKIEEAIESFKRAIAIYPDYLMAHNDLGVQYLNMGRLQEAQDRFEIAIELNVKAFNPNLNLGIVLVKQRNFSDAMERLNRALSIDSSSAAAHLYAGIASVEIDELQNAEHELSSSLSLGGVALSAAHFFLARVHLKKGEAQRAARELTLYLEAQPNGEYSAVARRLLEQLK